MRVCRTRAYLMLRMVESFDLPPDASVDCPERERMLAVMLRSELEDLEYHGGLVGLYSFDGTGDAGAAAKVSVEAGGASWVIGLKPDYALVAAVGGAVASMVVEAACTRPEAALPRVAPRLLLYKAWLDSCIGGNAAAIYAPLVPGEDPVALRVEDPVAAWRCVAERLREAARVAEAGEPPPPGVEHPPCMHCGYRGICPYARGDREP